MPFPSFRFFAVFSHYKFTNHTQTPKTTHISMETNTFKLLNEVNQKILVAIDTITTSFL